MPARAPPPALQSWRRVLLRLGHLVFKAAEAVRLRAMATAVEASIRVLSPQFHDKITAVSGTRRPPITPPSASKTAVESQLAFQMRCTHRFEPGDATAMKRYGAGRAGNFARCQVCQRRWKWCDEQKQYVDAPTKLELRYITPPGPSSASSAASSPSVVLGAVPKARAKAAASSTTTPAAPATRQHTVAPESYTIDSDEMDGLEDTFRWSETETEFQWPEDDP